MFVDNRGNSSLDCSFVTSCLNELLSSERHNLGQNCSHIPPSPLQCGLFRVDFPSKCRLQTVPGLFPPSRGGREGGREKGDNQNGGITSVIGGGGDLSRHFTIDAIFSRLWNISHVPTYFIQDWVTRRQYILFQDYSLPIQNSQSALPSPLPGNFWSITLHSTFWMKKLWLDVGVRVKEMFWRKSLNFSSSGDDGIWGYSKNSAGIMDAFLWQSPLWVNFAKKRKGLKCAFSLQKMLKMSVSTCDT